MSNIVSVILSTGTSKLINHLIDTGISVGTGKIWKEIKNIIGRSQDTIEAKLYGIIETSVLKFLYTDKDNDIFAAICEEIFWRWYKEGDLTIEQVDNVLQHYSEFVNHENILAWHQYLTLQIITDKELYQVFVVNNVQLIKESNKLFEKKITTLMQEALNDKENNINGDVKHINQALGKLAIRAKKSSSNAYSKLFDGDLINALEELFVMEKLFAIIKSSIVFETTPKMIYIEAYVDDEKVWQSEKIAYIANKDKENVFADIYKAECIDELQKCKALEDFVICIFNLTCEENSTFPINKVSVIFVDSKTDVLRFGIDISCNDDQTGELEYGLINWDEYEGLVFMGNWMDKFSSWMNGK